MSTQRTPEIDHSTNQLGLPPPERLDRTDVDGAERWVRGEIGRRNIGLTQWLRRVFAERSVITERSSLEFVSKVFLGNIAIVLAIAMLIQAPGVVLVATTFAFVSWLIVRGSIGGAVSEDTRNARALGLAVSSVALLAAAFIFTDVLRIALSAAGLAGLVALRFTAAHERWLPVGSRASEWPSSRRTVELAQHSRRMTAPIQPVSGPEAKLLTEASDAGQSGGATRNSDSATRARASFRRGARDRAYSDTRAGGAARSGSSRQGRRGVVRELSGERRAVVDRDVGRDHQMTWILPAPGNFTAPNVSLRLMNAARAAQLSARRIGGGSSTERTPPGWVNAREAVRRFTKRRDPSEGQQRLP